VVPASDGSVPGRSDGAPDDMGTAADAVGAR
jgi:hypothetical protein